MTRKQKGPGFSMGRGIRPNFKDLGSKPAVPKDNRGGEASKTTPSQAELIAQAEAKFGGGVKITPKSDMKNRIEQLQKKQQDLAWHEGKKLKVGEEKLLSNLIANYKKKRYTNLDPNIFDSSAFSRSTSDPQQRQTYFKGPSVTQTEQDKVRTYTPGKTLGAGRK